MNWAKQAASGGLLLCLTFALISPAFAQRPGQGPAPVSASVVQRQTVTSQQVFVGTVTPIRSAVIGSAVDGRVEEVMVDEGDLVSPDPGQNYPLVQLKTGTIQIELDAAQVELKIREAAMDELKINLPLEISEAASNVAASESRVQFAKLELDRARRLNANGGGLSQSELESTIANFEAENETLNALKILHKKLVTTADIRKAQAEAQVAAQREAIRLLEDRKSKYTIGVPFTGAVTRKIAEVGQWITSGSDVIEVVQLDPIEVTISVPQAQIQNLQFSLDQASAQGEEMKATIHLESSGETLTGTVQRIVPQADLLSRAFPVKIRLDNPKSATGHWLKPGMLAKVEMTIGSTTDKLLINKDALVLNDQSSTVVVIDRSQEPAVARVVSVETGQAVGSWIEIKGDLKVGDWVVVEGNERLRPNQPIKVINKDKLEPSISRQPETPDPAIDS